MAGRIVLFGATGYTGELTARALRERGAEPLLAGRSAERLARLASELGGLETAVADVAEPATVRALVGEGDVLVTTVGPFDRWGDPAVQAAILAPATYIDSTGEPAFIRRVFEQFGPSAERSGAALLTAMGYDWVPGNLAGAIALEQAGPEAVRVEVGYFITGDPRAGMSGGTMASLAGAMLEPGFAWRGGRIVTERGARRVRSFDVEGDRREAISASSSEHFGLPRSFPRLREVDAYLGWFGPASRPMQGASLATSAVTRIPGAKAGLKALAGRFVKGSTGGPDAAGRSQSGSHIVAIARGGADEKLAEVHLDGVNGYDFTAGMLAWSAIRAAEGEIAGTGALGPVKAFGVDALETGAAEAGISRTR